MTDRDSRGGTASCMTVALVPALVLLIGALVKAVQR